MWEAPHHVVSRGVGTLGRRGAIEEEEFLPSAYLLPVLIYSEHVLPFQS